MLFFVTLFVHEIYINIYIINQYQIEMHRAKSLETLKLVIGMFYFHSQLHFLSTALSKKGESRRENILMMQ